uniref:Putative dnaJ-related protein SCJ1-like n=1 Tax=Solanum chacoense TaxID=4108 RepID=A0A0V0H7R3_SOLCH
MMWDEWGNEFGQEYEEEQQQQEEEDDSYLKFDFLSVLSKPKDYYRILEVDYDATEEVIRSNFIRLALKWHPDKQKDQDSATSKFQEINEAYQGWFFFIAVIIYLILKAIS